MAIDKFGSNIAYGTDQNRGGPGLLVRTAPYRTGDTTYKSIASGGNLMISQTFKNKREELTLSQTYHRIAPSPERFVVTVPLNGAVATTGATAFVNPSTGTSYRIVDISESHSVREATAAQCNLQVSINPDVVAVNGATARKMLMPNEIDVETEGVAVDTVSSARLNDGQPARIAGSMCLDSVFSEDRSGTLFTVPTGKTYKLISLSEVHDVPDNDSGTSTITFKKCTTTQDPASAGTSVHASGTLDLKGADDTVLEVTLAVANATLSFAAGNRLCFFFNAGSADGSAFVRPTMTYEFEETTAGINGAADKIVAPGETLRVYFEQDDGLTAQATTEYDGVVTITLEPVAEDNERERLITHFITADEILPLTGATLFIARDTRWQVTRIEETHSLAETSATTLNATIERCQGTETVGGGDDLVGLTDLNMKGTINTVQTATVNTTGSRDILDIGDRLVLSADIDAGGTPTVSAEYAGTVTIRLRPVTASPVEEVYLNQYFRPNEDIAATGSDMFVADREYRVTHASFVGSVVETGTADPNLQLEKLTGTQAAEAGTDSIGTTDLDTDATINTIQNATVVTSTGTEILAAGNRLNAYQTNAGGAAVAGTDIEGCLTVRLEPTDSGHAGLRTGQIFVALDKSYEVMSVEASWGAPERIHAQCNLQIEKLTGTQASGAGARIIGNANIDLTGTINTVTSGTVVSSGNELLVAGNRINVVCVDDSGTTIQPGELDDLTVTIKLQAHADGIEPANEGTLFTAIGRTFDLVNVEAIWATAETTATTANLMIERLQSTEAPGGASGGNGDLLVGLTDINVKGTANTVATGTVVTAASVNQITDGDRIGFVFSDDAGTGTVVPTELDGLTITLYLVPRTLEDVATS